MSEQINTETQETTPKTTEEILYNNSDNESKEEIKEEVKEEVKPIEYKIELEDSLLDQDYLEKIVEFSKEQGFSNEVANKIAQRENQVLSNYIQNQEASHEKQVNDWQKQIEKDTEFGGEKFKENVNHAHQVIDKFASPEFKQLLNETGYGNHPELFKLFARIGQSMKDDSAVFGEKPTPKKTIEELFYGKSE